MTLVHTQAMTETLPLTASKEPEVTVKCHSSHEAISIVGKKCASWETALSVPSTPFLLSDSSLHRH